MCVGGEEVTQMCVRACVCVCVCHLKVASRRRIKRIISKAAVIPEQRNYRYKWALSCCLLLLCHVSGINAAAFGGGGLECAKRKH